MTASLDGTRNACLTQNRLYTVQRALNFAYSLTALNSEKKRKDCAFRRQVNEKPSIILGCPGLNCLMLRTEHAKLLSHSMANTSTDSWEMRTSQEVCVHGATLSVLIHIGELEETLSRASMRLLSSILVTGRCSCFWKVSITRSPSYAHEQQD